MAETFGEAEVFLDVVDIGNLNKVDSNCLSLHNRVFHFTHTHKNIYTYIDNYVIYT